MMNEKFVFKSDAQKGAALAGTAGGFVVGLAVEQPMTPRLPGEQNNSAAELGGVALLTLAGAVALSAATATVRYGWHRFRQSRQNQDVSQVADSLTTSLDGSAHDNVQAR